MEQFRYIDINDGQVTGSIETIFPGWCVNGERVCVFSPHDDDGIIGAGYTILASLRNQADVYVVIFCRGNAGYSQIEQKNSIESIREQETFNAYCLLGVKKENILRLNYSDFSVIQNIGWYLKSGETGTFKETLTLLRSLKITRLLLPNHYKEHIDHLAVNIIGSYDSPQSGDSILVDWGIPNTVKSVLEYSVWANLSPEDSLISRRSTELRANKIIVVSGDIEDTVSKGISEYKSQGSIIQGLIEARKEKRTSEEMFIEVCLAYDPRPKLDYSPYIKYLDNLKCPGFGI